MAEINKEKPHKLLKSCGMMDDTANIPDPADVFDITVESTTDSVFSQYPAWSHLPKLVPGKALESDFQSFSGRLNSTSTPFHPRTITVASTCLSPTVSESMMDDSALGTLDSLKCSGDLSEDSRQCSLLASIPSHIPHGASPMSPAYEKSRPECFPVLPKLSLFQDEKMYSTDKELCRITGKPLALSFPALSDQCLSLPHRLRSEMPCLHCSREKSHSDSHLSSPDGVCKYTASRHHMDRCTQCASNQSVTKSTLKCNQVVRPKLPPRRSLPSDLSRVVLSKHSDILAHESDARHDTGYHSDLSVELSAVDPASAHSTYDRLLSTSLDSEQLTKLSKSSLDVLKRTSSPVIQSVSDSQLSGHTATESFWGKYQESLKHPERLSEYTAKGRRSLGSQPLLVSHPSSESQLTSTPSSKSELIKNTSESSHRSSPSGAVASCLNVSPELFTARVVEKCAPRQLDRLIGRKMGCVAVDIISELQSRGLVHNLSLIMKYLPRRDLISVRKVNEDWKAMVDCDINATKRLAQRKQTRLAQSLQKENFGKKSSSPGLRPVTASVGPLAEVQQSVIRQSNQSQASPTVTVQVQQAIQLSQKYWREAEQLKNEETLRKCPQCNSPAKTEPLQDRARCTKGDCTFDFCIRCRGPFHGSRDCAMATTPKKQRPELKVGGRKSKKNLRRL